MARYRYASGPRRFAPSLVALTALAVTLGAAKTSALDITGRVVGLTHGALAGAVVLLESTGDESVSGVDGTFALTEQVHIVPRTVARSRTADDIVVYDLRGRRISAASSGVLMAATASEPGNGKPILMVSNRHGRTRARTTGTGPGRRTASARPLSKQLAVDLLTVSADGYCDRTLELTSVDTALGDVLLKPEPHAVTQHEFDGLACGYPWLDSATLTTETLVYYVLPNEDIQAILDSADDYDIVRVARGTYYLDSSVVLMQRQMLLSIDGPSHTIIDAQRYSRCVLMTEPYTVVDGFTLRNGDAAGPRNWGPPRTNEGLCNDGGGVFTCGCLCIGFSAGPVPVVRNCIIVGNNAGGQGGGGAHLKGGTLHNCLVAYNTADQRGGGITVKLWTVEITNSTIANNGDAGIWIRQTGSDSHLSLVNSIVADNASDFESEGFANFAVTNCLLTSLNETGVDTANVTIGSAGFVAAADTNFRLLPTSDAVDGGNVDGLDGLGLCHDLDGFPRQAGVSVDLGQFELQE